MKAFLQLLKNSGIALFLASPFVMQEASASFCGDGIEEKLRCNQALELLREIMPNEKKKNEPKVKIPAPQLRPATFQKTKKDNRQEKDKAIIYIPFPTPKPSHNKKPEIDPTTTQGIFSKCIKPKDTKDADILKYSRKLSQKHFCLQRKTVRENGLKWVIFTLTNADKKNGPFFIAPHDNEDSAFAAGLYGVEKYGGKLVFLETGEERFLKHQDPNRNFGFKTSIVKSCSHQAKASPRFTKAMLRGHKRGKPIIALHSNSNGWSGNGGSGTVSARRKQQNVRPFISAINRSRRLQDEDTVIFLASTKSYKKDRKIRKAIDYFTKKIGTNVLVERVNRQNNDCSLSNHVVLNNLGDYYNIEVEKDDVKTHKKLVDAVVQYSH